MKHANLLFYSSTACIYVYSIHYHFAFIRDGTFAKMTESLKFFTIWNFVSILATIIIVKGLTNPSRCWSAWAAEIGNSFNVLLVCH
jgi:hypothetical protein